MLSALTRRYGLMTKRLLSPASPRRRAFFLRTTLLWWLISALKFSDDVEKGSVMIDVGDAADVGRGRIQTGDRALRDFHFFGETSARR